MKKFTKLLGTAVLAIMLVLSLTVSAFATDITISGGVSGSEYAAYKLLNATDGGDGKFAYTLNDTYADILKAVTGKDEQADIVDYVNNLDSEGIREFANAVYNAILEADPAISADYTTANDVFADVEQGYYLIAETKLGDTADTFSLVMLDTAGEDDITVNTKEDKPSVEKKVEETNDSTGNTSWGDSADYDIGDVINFAITGTVSSKYADYKSYYYSFSDAMTEGLTYNEDAKVYVVNGEDKVEVTEQFTIVSTNNAETGLANGFTATANLKELADVTVNASTTIVVEYTATLNENAAIGVEGNKNEVFLQYENNPLHEADGDTDTDDKPEEPSKTPVDVNIVFTFQSTVNKVDKDGNALEGAGFTLYKWVAEANDWVEIKVEAAGAGVTEFNFKGLDVGKYKLAESTVPSGYNKCEDIIFEIVAEYDETTDPHTLTALSVKNEAGEIVSEGNEASFSVDLTNGKVATDVLNLSGDELPETGGIGTTIFYIAGGLLVVGALVLLIAKKRMKAE